MPKIDLTNKKYRFFTVLEKNLEKSKNSKNVWWNCQCECGKIFTATTTDINKGKAKSCGCKKALLLSEAHLQDITGQTFGELLVLERDLTYPQNGKKNRTYWKCQCSCGTIISVGREHLVNRYQSSCGCKQSIGELNIAKLLRENNIPFIAQYTNTELKTIHNGYLRFDFAIQDENNNIVRLVEFDGPQHHQEQNYWNTDSELIQLRDNQKNEYAKKCNIPLVRIPYSKRDSLTLDNILGDHYLV